MKSFFAILFLVCGWMNGYTQQILTLQPDAVQGKDANIVDYYGNQNLGNFTYLHIARWTHDGIPSKERALIDFDLSGLPDNATILAARLYLFADAFTPGVPPHRLVTTNAFTIQRVISAWDEQTLTWNNQPNVTALHQETLPPTGSTTQNYEINVKTLLEDTRLDPQNSFGFMLTLINETTLYNCLNFFSSDSPFPNTRPKLEIVYTLPASPETKLNIYELITPNQDGKNDFFIIDGLDNFPSHEVSVYNEWGNVVFHSTSYTSNWNGGDLAGGMYYYVVKVNDTAFTGKVYLEK